MNMIEQAEVKDRIRKYVLEEFQSRVSKATVPGVLAVTVWPTS